jgi:hypothetical protein
MSKAKLGMTRTPKIPDNNQRQKLAKSRKSGFSQFRIIRNASDNSFDLSISMYCFGDASRRCRGRVAWELTKLMVDKRYRTTAGTRFFQRPLAIESARRCGGDIFEHHRPAICDLKYRHDRRALNSLVDYFWAMVVDTQCTQRCASVLSFVVFGPCTGFPNCSDQVLLESEYWRTRSWI